MCTRPFGDTTLTLSMWPREQAASMLAIPAAHTTTVVVTMAERRFRWHAQKFITETGDTEFWTLVEVMVGRGYSQRRTAAL
jgi:hypothetical protein